MTDHIRIKAIDIADDRVDAQTDRRVISGTVHVSAAYGESTFDLPIRFHGKASHDEAVAEALRHVEHLGHFLEVTANRTRLEYRRGA
jgi:hypothetical protein